MEELTLHRTMRTSVINLFIILSCMISGGALSDWEDPVVLDVCLDAINCSNNDYTNTTTANPDDCGTYFICRDYTLYVTPCPGGTKFDYVANACNTNPGKCKPQCTNSLYRNHVFTSTTRTVTSSGIDSTTEDQDITSTEFTEVPTTEQVSITTIGSTGEISTTLEGTSTRGSTEKEVSEAVLTTVSVSTTITVGTAESTLATDTSTTLATSTVRDSITGEASTLSVDWTEEDGRDTSVGDTATRSVTTAIYQTSTTRGTPTLLLTMTSPNGSDPVEGSRAEFQCIFRYPQSAGSPAQSFEFRWYVSGLPLSTNMESGRIRVTNPNTGTSGEFKSTLEFTKVKISDAGLIECAVLYNGPFSMIDGANLTVLTRPVVSISPLTQTKRPDTDLVLRCRLVSSLASSSSSRIGLRGASNLNNHDTTIEWFENGQLLFPSERINITFSLESGVSQLTVRRLSNSSDFSCLATNPITGKSSEQSARVYVLQPSDLSCAEDHDIASNMTWGITATGLTALEPCPAGTSGTVSRRCTADGQWAEPDFDECLSHEITDLLSQIEMLQDGLGSGNSSYVAGIASQLENFTAAQLVLNVANLEASIDAVDGLADLRESSVNSSVEAAEIQAVVSSISNLMGPSSLMSWGKIQQKLNSTDGNNSISNNHNNNNNSNSSPAVKLLSASDKYGRVMIRQLSEEETFVVPADNLVLSATTMRISNLDESLVLPVNESIKASRDWYNPDDVMVLDRETLVKYAEGDTISVSTTYYRNMNAIIQPISSEEFVGSKILSVTVKELEGKSHLDPKINITLTHNKTDMNTSCVFWRYASDSAGQWSSEGCTKVGGNHTHTLCQCDHLTNFAILMSRSPKDNLILSLISIIGCCISIAAMVLTIVFYCLLWKHVRSHHAVVLINLCIALIIANALFIGGVDKTDPQVLCKVIAALLHYFYLASFFMMLAEGVEMLLYIIFVFHVRRKLETALLIFAAWFIPAVIVAVSLGITRTDGYGGAESCWLSVESGLLWAFVGPALFVCLLNMIIVAVVLIRISQSRFQMDKNEKKNRVRSTIWNILVICPILGTTWVFGVLSLAFSSIVFQYIFAVSNSLQGLFIFIFHVLFNNRKTKGKLVLSFTSTICMGRDSSKTASRSSNSGSGSRSRVQRPSTSPFTGTSTSAGSVPAKSFTAYPDTTVKTSSSNTTVKTDITMLEAISVVDRQISSGSGVSGRSGRSLVEYGRDSETVVRRNGRCIDVMVGTNSTPVYAKVERNGRANDVIVETSSSVNNSRHNSDGSSASVREESSSSSNESLNYNERLENSKHKRHLVSEGSNLLSGATRRQRLDSVEENDDSSLADSDTTMQRVHSRAALTGNSDRTDNNRISKSREHVTSIYPEKGFGGKVVQSEQYDVTPESSQTSHTQIQKDQIELTSL